MIQQRTRRPVPAAVLAVVLFAAACAAEESDGTDRSSAPAGPTASAEARVAPGVTADGIKVGIVYPDLTAVRKFLDIDHGDYEATYNALIAQINNAGGINGRKIVPVYGAVDMASPAAAQQVCARLTQDEKVFAVIGTFNGREPLCYVQTNRTAVVGGPLTAKNYALAQAPWFSVDRGGEEVGDTMGLFAAGNASPARRSRSSAWSTRKAWSKTPCCPRCSVSGSRRWRPASSMSTWATWPPSRSRPARSARKFQAAGADTVVVVGGMAARFPQVLEAGKYRPRLLFAPVASAMAYTADGGARLHDAERRRRAGDRREVERAGHAEVRIHRRGRHPGSQGQTVRRSAQPPAGRPGTAELAADRLPRTRTLPRDRRQGRT
ncbi:ABC transporter substrate-binding protein [Yinghuangia aomiensis]